MRLTLEGAEATDALGRSLARAVSQRLDAVRASGLHANLSGDLGAGKTSLVRAMLRELGVTGPIKSPTFALLEPYVVSSLDFYHFDFYRLEHSDEFAAAGFRELFGAGRICAVEWPERAGLRLPTADISITLTVDGGGRLATFGTASRLGEACLSSAMAELQAAGVSLPAAPARSSSH